MYAGRSASEIPERDGDLAPGHAWHHERSGHPLGTRLGKVFRDAAQDSIFGLDLSEDSGRGNIWAGRLEIGCGEESAIEAADCSPFLSVGVNRQLSRPQALREIFPCFNGIAHSNDV